MMDRLAERWDRDGEPLAAGLWWLAFLLYTGGILAVLTSFEDSTHAKAYILSSRANLRQISLGLVMYAQDYDERLPPMHDLAAARQALEPYTKGNDALWHNPDLGVPFAVNPSLSYRSLGDFADPSRIVTFWDTRLYRGENGPYRIVGLLDGHVDNAPSSDWPRLRAVSGIERDAPVAKEPPPRRDWLPKWLRRLPPDLVGPAALGALALVVSFVASWREANVWARGQESGYLSAFLGRFAVRFLGHGSLVILAAPAALAVGVALLGALRGTFARP